MQNRSINENTDVTLVVFDDRVSDLETLYQALLPGSIIFTLNSSQDDGLDEITELLAETGADCLSIVAHGTPGTIHLGKTPINIEQLQAQSHLLQQWGVAKIDLYSCEVAKGDVGKQFVSQFGELTGATIAAADAKIGCADLGGTWNLVTPTGETAISTTFQSKILQNYRSILPVIGLVSGINPIEGGLLGTFEITLDAPAPAGGIIVNFNTTGSTATLNLDYALSAGTGITAVTANTFTIAAGATSATLHAIAYPDAIIDPNETIALKITAGTGYTLSPLTSANNFVVPGQPISLKTGDFNGDGKLDLVAADELNDKVIVLLGNGSGGFGAPTTFTVNGSVPASVDVGDFNGDGKLDLVTANYLSDNLSVLFGNGAGGFSTPTNFAVGARTKSVKVGDFNSDGKLDLVAPNYGGGKISVLFGNGTGGFSPVTNLLVSGSGIGGDYVNTGDLNSDSNLDIIVVDYTYNKLIVFFGDGLGLFSTAMNFNVPSSTSVNSGDFNGDSKLDLVTSNFVANTLTVLIGNGTGGFDSINNYAVGTRPQSVTVGDLNSDGKLDLVSANIISNNVSVIFGDGSGGFSTPTNFVAGNSPHVVTVGDLNGDSKLDIIAGGVEATALNTISVLLNNSGPSASSTASLTITDTPFARRNDFGKDYKSDILWRNTNGAVALWQMDGANILSNSIVAASVDNSWKISSTGDFNNDQKSDILWRNTNGAVALWQMDGANILSNSIVAVSVDNSWKISSTGDFNRDGKSDILWRNTNGATSLWLMNGSNILSTNILSNVDNTWKITGTADFNGDGKADILWRNDNGAVALWQMDGSTIVSTSIVSTVSNDWQIKGVDDFDGNGKADILWRNNVNGGVRLWSMNGASVATDSYVAGNTADWKISGTGDFSGDGKSDILWRNDNGAAAIWGMNGATILSTNNIATVDNSWSIAAPIL
jgi:hypothetical protein